MRLLANIIRHNPDQAATGSPLSEIATATIGWDEDRETSEALKLEWSVEVCHCRARVTVHASGHTYAGSIAELQQAAEREVWPALERCKRRALAAAETL